MKHTQACLCAFLLLSGCGGGNGELDEPGSIEQALSVATCRVTGGGADTQNNCTTPVISFAEKTIFTTVTTDVPGAIFEWDIKSISGGVTRGPGCGAINNSCEVRVKPVCRGAPSKEVVIKVKVRRPNGGPVEETTVRATVPNVPCVDIPAPTCVEPPRSIPALDISSEYCGGLHRTNWTSVAGATHYQVQSKPSGMDWNRVWDVYDFPGITVDMAGFQCAGDSFGEFRQRARACNECGCGPWGNEDYHSYFYGECR